ncbi:iron ABC transporter substrate-binding protein [Skermanella stibiiresistens SB22]|uniref:Iron ABC transporter substrate-binding protein n=1 Tax=Skermanella stibiiresistens SB22 TaxID=1385369 RepID=W9H4M2_9PROT|nr:iron ABC transporter substrate-binding protein [Skermanella stibiiresistens SB22]
MGKTLLILGLLLPLAYARPVGAVEVTDIAGRHVAVPAKVERVILGEGRYLPALAILDRDDPVRRVVGMMGEFALLDPASYQAWLQRFPELAEVTPVGQAGPDSFGAEKALALAPDLAIFGIEGHSPSPKAKELLDQLEASGVPVIFVDFRKDPLVNTPRSVELLGEVLGRQREAAEFVEYYRSQMDLVTSRLAGVTTRPKVFVEARVGLSDECCATMGNGMIGRFIEQAGGFNIATALVPGVSGTVNLEYLLANQPDIYLATAIGSTAGAGKMPKRVALGPDVEPDFARETLARSLKRPGIADLDAVASGRAHAIWHHFYNSPFNVAAVQIFAKWFHPDLFADLDPEGTLRSLYRRFQPVAYSGTYWVDLK